MASRVENVKRHLLIPVLYYSSVLLQNCGGLVFRELVVTVGQDQACFTHRSVAHQHQFDWQVVTSPKICNELVRITSSGLMIP